MESLGSVMGESLWRYDNITPERVTSAHAYAAAGRLVKEGDKMYSYGWLDKIINVQENGTMVAAFDYHVNGQIASATYADKTENFLWDGLALIHRAGTNYINEPYVTGGNPILSSNGDVMFNDMLGTTLGVKSGEQVNQVNMTAFGEPLRPATNGDAAKSQDAFFTGKPHIGELGYAFLFRNYRPEQGKWQTADPLGYPDGWNNLAYVNNGVTSAIDWLGKNIYDLNNKEAASNRGHSLPLGTWQDSSGQWHGTGFDYGGASSGSGTALDVFSATGSTEQEVLTKLISHFDPTKKFDRMHKWDCNTTATLSAVQDMQSFVNNPYDPSNHNCRGVLESGLSAAGIAYTHEPYPNYGWEHDENDGIASDVTATLKISHSTYVVE